MSLQLLAAIVRILTTDGVVVGTGFLVEESTIVTCAHVVAGALGLRETPLESPKDLISLDFPLVAAGDQRTAQVSFWQPVQENGRGDIALLYVENPLPDSVGPVRLVVADNLWGHTFRVFGFPIYHDPGVWASGRLLEREATGWIQAVDLQETGKRVQEGFSGGAVWDEQLDGVVGMVVASDKDDNKVAYLIPSKTLIELVPTLGHQAISPCPYRGLFAFQEQDTQYFFGREAFTEQLTAQVRQKPLVVVVGTSGSGKSSTVFAGLLPRLRQQAGWFITSMRPGDAPLQSLATALLALLEPDKSDLERRIAANTLAGQFEQGTLTCWDIIELIMQRHISTRLVVIIDQFEELYAPDHKPQGQQQFLNLLLAAIKSSSRKAMLPFTLVITLRADFLGQALSSRAFADTLQSALMPLGPMTRDELSAAIRKPAEKMHVEIGGELVERMLNEVGQQAGRLPLLEFTLTDLWNQQQQGKLTNTAYEAIGGIEKALTKHADEIYTRLNEEQQRQVQRIFVQLVHAGEGTEDTRRIATYTEIGEQNWSLVVLLADARLVVTGRDQTSGQETVEVIHEALIRTWQRLRAWINEDREFLGWQERMRGALRQWKRNEYDAGALLRGSLLVEALQWTTTQGEKLSEDEKLFIQKSQQEEQHWKSLYLEAEQQRQEAERQRQLAEQQKQEAERLQKLTEQHRQEAVEQRQEAQRQQQIALARSLAMQAQLLSTKQNPLFELSVLLAIESLQRLYTLEAHQVLLKVVPLLRHCITSIAFDQKQVPKVIFSHDGRLLALSRGISVDVWEIESGQQVISFAHKERVLETAFTPDGRFLSIGSEHAIGMWNMITKQCEVYLTLKQQITGIAFSPDAHLAATTSGNNVFLWDLLSKKQVAILSHKNVYIGNIIFSSSGNFLLINEQSTLHIWSTTNGQLINSLGTFDNMSNMAFSPDEHFLVVAFKMHLELWDFIHKQQVVSFPFADIVNDFAFSPKGDLLAIAVWGEAVQVWDIIEKQRLPDIAYQDIIFATKFHPNGQILATASRDKTIEIQQVITRELLASLSSDAFLGFSPDGYWFATSHGSNVKAWQVIGGPYIRIEHEYTIEPIVTFNPEGSMLAIINNRTGIDLWDITKGQYLATIADQDQIYAATFSVDGCSLFTVDSEMVRLWNVADRRCFHSFPHQNKWDTDIWEMVNGQQKATIALGYPNASQGQEHLKLIFNNSTGVEIWDVIHKKQIFSLAASIDVRGAICGFPLGARIEDTYDDTYMVEIIHTAALSPNESLLATPKDERSVGVWQISNGEQIASLLHQDRVRAVAFSPDGRFLCTASDDHTIKIWDTEYWQQVALLPLEGKIIKLTFSPDGHILTVISQGSRKGFAIVQLWLYRPEDLINEAQVRLNRNLTQEEWKQYLGDEPYRKRYPHLP